MKWSKLLDYSPLGLYMKLLGKMSGESDTGISKMFRSVLAKYTGSEMTGADKQKADYEDELADENATLAYERQKEFQELYLTPEAQLKSQAAGFDAIGMNRMLMAGSQPGASASSVPQSSGGTAGALAGSGDILALLSNFALKSKQLEIEEGHLENENKKIDAEVEGLDIRNSNLQELLDLQKGDLSKKIEFLGQQIETEPVKRALLKTEIGLKQAETAVQVHLADIKAVESKYADAYWAAQTGIAQAYAKIADTNSKFQRKLLEQQIGINAKQIEIMHQTIVTGKLNNGLLAKQLTYYDADRTFARWNTGISTAAKAVGAVAGIAMGGAAIGKLAPIKSVMNSSQPVTDYYGAYEGLPGM